MALTLLQLAQAARKYANRGTYSAHDRAALDRNFDLFEGRVDAAETALRAVVAVVEPVELSSDPSAALFQLLAATGHPVTFNAEGATISIDPMSVLAKATPEQARELALLGFFGTGGAIPSVDYSLYEMYYERVGGSNNWKPKEPYMDSGTWQSYIASKGA